MSLPNTAGEAFDHRAVFGDDLGGVAYAARDAKGRLTVLVKGARTASRLRSRFGRSVRVRLIDRQRLDGAPSLQDLAAIFGPGAPVYDPSAVASRAHTLTRFVLSMRAVLGDSLSLALFSTRERAVVLVLRQPDHAEADAVNAVLARAQRAFLALRDQAVAEGFAPTIRFTFDMPRGGLTPIDRRSLRRMRLDAARRRLGRAAAGSVSILSMATSAAQAQVVGQAGVQGGQGPDGSVYGVEGAVGMAGEGLRFQADGSVLDLEDGTASDVAAHFFSRDSAGLIGVTARWGEVYDASRWQFGVEAERFFDRMTLTGEVGYEDSDAAGSGAYGYAGVGFYPTDHMSLYFTGGHTQGEGVGQVSFEVQPAADAMPALSLFADAGIGVASEGFILAGLRFTFGARSSLIERDRRELIRKRVSSGVHAPDSTS